MQRRIEWWTSAIAVLLGLSLSGPPAATAAAVPPCANGLDGTIDLEVETALVMPEILKNGIPWVTSAENAVSFFLVQEDALSLLIARTDLAPAAVRVARGTYDVLYRKTDPTNPLLPRNQQFTLLEDVVIAGDGTLSIDVPAVSFEGELTLDGQPFNPSPLERGEIWALPTSLEDEIYLGDTNDGAFSAVLIAGEYHLVYRWAAGSVAVPRNTNAIVATVDVGASPGGPRPFDLVSESVSGNFLFNGAPTVMSAVERGSLDLVRTTVLGEDRVHLGDTDDLSYSSRGLVGTYDVFYREIHSGTLAPRNAEALVATNRRINGAPLDVDIPVVTLEGSVSFNGALAPASLAERGVLAFRQDFAGEEDELLETNEQTFSHPVVPGTYTFRYSHIQGGVFVPSNDSVPVLTDHVVPPAGVGQLDLDISTFEATIGITLNGSPMPAGASVELSLLNEDGSLSLPLGTVDAAGWAGHLVVADYLLRLDAASGPGMPANEGTVLGALPFAETSTPDLVVDLRTIDLAPTLQVDGAPFPNGSSAVLALVGEPEAPAIGLGNDPASWLPVTVLQGSYDVAYLHVIGDALPRNGWFLLGCVDADPALIFRDGFETGDTSRWTGF